MPTAVITGIAGQDGSYLAELLVAKGYQVHGITRPGAPAPWRLAPLLAANPASISLHELDLLDGPVIDRFIAGYRPHEIYHLACRGNVPLSLSDPGLACSEDVMVFTRLLEALRAAQEGSPHRIRFCHAGSADMFGSAPAPQNERTPFQPRSPFGAAKTYCHHLARSYREAFGLHVANAILFNRTSPRCALRFLTRKVTRAAASISLGLQRDLALGNLEVWRDWGFAGDHMEAMWTILQQERPDDYVVGTAKSHSVRDLLDQAFSAVGLDWHQHCRSEPALLRPADVGHLWADTTKLLMDTGWKARTGFAELIRGIVAEDLAQLRGGAGDTLHTDID
jgi:GDPmannose 4,6-dehydratase